VELGPELLRGPNGVWFSGLAPDGGAVGVLRFDPRVVPSPAAVDRLVERTVAARAGLLPGVLPVVDLVRDGGRVWLITAAPPVPESAIRTERALLGPAMGPDRPRGPIPEPYRRSLVGRVLRILVGLALVGGVAGAAVVAGLKVRSKPSVTPLQVSGISVVSPAGYTSTSICDASLVMRALLQTNDGTGTVVYHWDLPGSPPVKSSQQVKGASPQELDLTWRLRLHGSGTVTAKFTIDDAAALAPGAAATGSASFPYQCK
jgi:hypothetical protein